MMIRPKMLALSLAAALSGGYAVGEAHAGQSHMQAALDSLFSARSQLQSAKADKGGHRVKAIRRVNEAIHEVKAGMDYARGD